jgi:3',5'-cyclic AMP phosphodiesterase CpdA
MERQMSKHDDRDLEVGTMNRRRMLECMAWAGTGIIWTVVGGIPRPFSLTDTAAAAAGFSFVQISDSHIGFDKPANPDTAGTLQDAIARVGALSPPPAFLIHTGDITHLSRPEQFDAADQIIKGANLPVRYVPGEHDVIDDNGKAYIERYGRDTMGTGWYSFDAGGVHFVALVNVMNFKAGGLGNLGSEQIAWLEKDARALSASTPIVIFAHMPLWTIYQEWGWGTADAEQALSHVKRFGSVTVLNGHIHQIVQKVEGNITFRTARSTAYPQPEAGKAKAPGPLAVPHDQLKQMLGVRTVAYDEGKYPLSIEDTSLAAG